MQKMTYRRCTKNEQYEKQIVERAIRARRAELRNPTREAILRRWGMPPGPPLHKSGNFWMLLFALGGLLIFVSNHY